ncbi:hypothetical protein [Microbacterium paludicola]|uniref:hypothetical protein n=1 Tax=Microbacterium paludicola TaxID=300019 RepID=UPI0011A21084|nr:hypothetical protein [Microbacterium paludicola]
MTINTYNDDPRYEMMAAILPGENENTPDASTVVDDLREILKLCYIYSAPQPPKEFSAADLGEAIVAYLVGQWTWDVPNFEKAAKEHWGYDAEPSTPAEPAPAPIPELPEPQTPNWGHLNVKGGQDGEQD